MSIRAHPWLKFRVSGSVILAFFLVLAPFIADAGDILRGGATVSSARKNAAARANAGAAEAAEAKANAQDRLARTTQTIQAVQAMQHAARNVASNLGPDPNRPGAMLPNVPDGLGIGGLDLIGAPTGANAPTQSGTKVTVRQTAQQAILNWRTFNVGKKTTLYFDQRQGGSDAGKWIAFNKVSDPSGSPSQIIGSIKAEGQVYIINQNGIIFGGASQVNVRTLVASSLPINDNLVANGLLNNPEAQFLFNAIRVDALNQTSAAAQALPKIVDPRSALQLKYQNLDNSEATLILGADYALATDANRSSAVTLTAVGLAKLAAAKANTLKASYNALSGDITVQPGAILTSPVSADGNGGRVMLAGANVTNSGILSTPSGQTIMAAGLQVGIQAHASDDPSLRGMDVWIGNVGNYAGIATNNALIEALTGSITIAGKEINQRGALESSTSVNLNGRIDLLASYGAVSNPNYDNPGSTGPPFVNQFTGIVRMEEGSVTRILPDYASLKTIPGTSLPESSQINIEGSTVYFGQDSIVLAPSGNVHIRAGTWPYKDQGNNGTVFAADGTIEPGLQNFFEGAKQRFLLSGGQVYLSRGAIIDVSGSTDIFVPLSQYILNVTMRGTELADSPLQRDGMLRGLPLVVDIRRTGNYRGRFWMGTPLGDLTGLAGIIERNVAQLTALGGTINIESGGSIVVTEGATLDVSGGYFRHEGGRIQTTRLVRGGRHIIDIDDATPDLLYDSIYDGKFSTSSTKWGMTKTYLHPLAPLGAYNQQEYIEGAGGGTISLSAPNMTLSGKLVGRTIKGARQLDAPPVQGSLKLAFRAEKQLDPATATVPFVPFSPNPPDIFFVNERSSQALDSTGGQFAVSTSLYKDEGGGFGQLEIENLEGEVLIPRGTKVQVPARGSLVIRAANIAVEDDIIAPGGTISLTAYNFSPFLFQELQATGALIGVPAPLPVEGRGIITVNSGVRLSVAGMIVDDRPTSPVAFDDARVLDAGSLTLEGYSILLAEGSVLDASGGAWAKPAGGFEYGTGGDIAILAGKDPDLATTTGGKLELGATLLGYSGTVGGSLTIQANLIQVGGGGASEDAFVLQPDFFRQGGFTKYSLIGIGARNSATGEYLPGVRIAAGTVIEPVAGNWLAVPFGKRNNGLALRPFLKPKGLRAPTSLELSAIGADDPFTTAFVEALGLVVLEEGSRITIDPGASVVVEGDAVAVLGTIEAPGGLISISGRDEFRLSEDQKTQATSALPTVYIGPSARLSAAGTTVLLPDPFGRRSGIVYPGGVISIAGNIVAEAGAVLDVSGASAVLDFHPSRLATADSQITIPLHSGLMSRPWGQLSVPVRVDSNGGLIELQGGQMLYSDATLLGRAGGPAALGGTLSISSGRFYPVGAIRTGADINLIVEQSGSALDFGGAGRFGDVVALMSGRTGFAPAFTAGVSNPGIGYFSVDSFNQGGFDSLDLGFKYFSDANPIPYGGNVEFRGPVTINARGFVRVAGGGVLKADAPVTINARYVAIGQEFRPPLNPDDIFVPFATNDPTAPGGFFFPPTTGPGTISINASLIDVGTLSFQNIGTAHFNAAGGDIRGNGTLDIAGDLTLTAAQIYPTTLAAFNIFAYDRNIIIASSSLASSIVTLASSILPPGFGVGSPLLGSTVLSINGTEVTLAANANAALTNRPAVYAPGSGSVTIVGFGTSAPPLSAGGSLSIFASTITQGGTLRAPLGSITLGWDGTDIDPSDADLDSPLDPIAGTAFGVPVANLVTLTSGSVTSVAALDLSGNALLIPFGLSPDGLTWIDPRGLNVTVSGLPKKKVSIAGNSVVTEAGSLIDIRGGGDLLAFRWIEGNGGSIDLLGTATSEWGSGVAYEAGALVTYRGQTWSARVAIDPTNFTSSPSPSVSNRYWALVPESYAIIPGFGSGFAPYNVFNTGADLLGGDPGYVAGGLRLGDQIYLNASPGLPAGFYTLLPRRYALFPGAFLITPQDGSLVASTDRAPFGAITVPEGSSYAGGYRFNGFTPPAEISSLRSLFEIAPASVVQGRVDYEIYSANTFMREAAARLDIAEIQELPGDAGYLSFHGNMALNLQGNVLAEATSGGRDAVADISSFADIYLVGGTGSAPAGATAVLNTGILSSWGIESLLIGGLRRQTDIGTVVDVRTSGLTLNNPGGSFFAPEIILASKGTLTLTPGSSIASSGGLPRPAEALFLNGDGTLLRVSGDIQSAIVRSALTGSTLPFMTIGAGATISGTSVILDSTYATSLDPAANLIARALTLGSGQISLLFDNASGVLSGSLFDPHLVLSGEIFREVQNVRYLTLQSYRTIDIYGTGTFGSDALQRLQFLAGGIRGYEQGAGSALFVADDILFDNPAKIDSQAVPSGPLGGELRFDADVIRFGSNDFYVKGYQDLVLDATSGILGQGTGSFTTLGNLIASTPLITGTRGSVHSVTASGIMELLKSTGEADLAGGLGASFTFKGTDVLVNTDILLPSGGLILQATSGDVTVRGQLSVAGTSQNFYDLIRYADAGQIILKSEVGDVSLLNGSSVSVAAAAEGGNAGTLSVSTPLGVFTSDGALAGSAHQDYLSGSFFLDAGTIASFAEVNDPLNAGGFLQERNLRVRSGDVVIDGNTRVRNFTLSADQGGITVTGTINASGETGGKIALAARDSVILSSTAKLTVAAEHFSNAGKGGEIRLEAGNQHEGVVNLGAMLDIQAGSLIDLSVADFVAGDYTTPGSSAFYGQFTGKLHLRAPRNGNDLNADSIEGAILGASSVVVEGYRLYDRTGIGTLDNALRSTIHADANNFIAAGHDAVRAKLLSGNPNASALDSVLVIAPGVEIINRTGDLVLGTPSSTNTADWDLSGFRYGPKQAPGILTLRATGDLVFNNALSDGFTPVTASINNGNSALWLAPLMTINPNLPVNTQSWSYRLTAGADLAASDFRSVLPADQLAAGQGSLLVGEFYNPVPDGETSGINAAIGVNGTTENTIQGSAGSSINGTRYEVVRTGAGDIDINAGRDVQLRNQFATIYTAGVALPVPTTVFTANDFVVPVLPTTSPNRHPSQSGGVGINLGAIQQVYPAQWSMAGGDVRISAGQNIGRYTMDANGDLVADSSRQLPTNWLYRRGYVDPATGLFASDGGVDSSPPITSVTDTAPSTAWWVDFSNFFEGVGALGGGDVTVLAGNDIVNVEAFMPTNARMAGRDPASGLNLAPDEANLLELGGGDLIVRAGNNIDGGVYYVERGVGTLFAGGSITTNEARSSSISNLSPGSPEYGESTWLPTTLFAGKAVFDVGARGDVLLGPVINPFLLPQALNNKFWYKTYFNTFSPTTAVNVSSLGGSVTHRTVATMPGAASPVSLLRIWLDQSVFTGTASTFNASNYQPWIRLAESDLTMFSDVFGLSVPTLRSTAFAGDINLVGGMTLFPSPIGTLELAAAGNIVGLHPTGTGQGPLVGQEAKVWIAASVNLSDADPSQIPGTASPLAYQSLSEVGRDRVAAIQGTIDILARLSAMLRETGAYTGAAGAIEVKRALHDPGILHASDLEPARIYATGGDITGLTLFAAKQSQIFAERDITDVAFYLQNSSRDSISIVSAGRDIIPSNENAPIRALADDFDQGNIVAGTALAGDIQISGPGYLEVLAGRNLDLGTGANLSDGTGVGITSIGNSRNPFLPFSGAGIIAMAGVGGREGGPAVGLAGSSLNFEGLVPDSGNSGGLSTEQLYIDALDAFFETLRTSAQQPEPTDPQDPAAAGSAPVVNYDAGFAAIQKLFGSAAAQGEIFTRARDIRTASGGAITIAVPGGGLTMASDIFGNPLTPPGIVTEFGGAISIFTHGSVDIGRTRIFTLRGGDLTIWSSTGDIAAGTAPKTVVTAPPTRVLIDSTSGDIQTDLGGLATGGGIGVLASVEGVEEGNVTLLAPNGTVDAGDAGIRATGDITIAAVTVLNADNIAAGGNTVGVPAAPAVAAPNIAGLTAASNTAGASTSALEDVANQALDQAVREEEAPSIITAEVLGYGGVDAESVLAPTSESHPSPTPEVNP